MKKSSILFVALCLFFYCIFDVVQVVDASQRVLSHNDKDLEMERQLKILNKPYLKSIKTKYGEIYDCVDIYKQPAFDHPLLKHHTIQMPSSYPDGVTKRRSNTSNFINFRLDESCPAGTVLIRRSRKEDLMNANNYILHAHTQDGVDKLNYYAVMVADSRDLDGQFSGAVTLMDIFKHPNVSINQATSGQVILINGEKTIQFGWHIFYQVNGDLHTHFFTYWTSDGYQKTGCFNMLCPGYVQLSNTLTPGMIIPAGRGVIKPSVSKDPNTGNWMLVIEDNDHDVLGYWPKEIFNMESFTRVQIGGVSSSPKDEPYPPMGSGIPPGDPGVCQFKQVGLQNVGSHKYLPPHPIGYIVDIPKVYRVQGKDGDGDEGYVVEFGGSGGKH